MTTPKGPNLLKHERGPSEIQEISRFVSFDVKMR